MASAIDPTKPADGTYAVKGDVRANFQTTATEITALQDATQALPITVGRTPAATISDYYNIKDFGASADGTIRPVSELFGTLAEAQAYFGSHVTALTDGRDWAALQKMVDEETPIFVPANATVELDNPVIIQSSLQHFGLRGANRDTSLIRTNSSTFPSAMPMFFQVEGFIGLDNTQRDIDNNVVTGISTGTVAGFRCDVQDLLLKHSFAADNDAIFNFLGLGISSTFKNLRLQGRNRAIVCLTGFSTLFEGIEFDGSHGNSFDGTADEEENFLAEIYTRCALLIGGHSTVSCCDVTGWHTGIAIRGFGVAVDNCRFEVNGRALLLGYELLIDGAGVPNISDSIRAVTAGRVSACTFEHNVYSITIQSVSFTSFENILINGTLSTSSFPIDSRTAVDIASSALECTVDNLKIVGRYIDTPIKVTATSNIKLRSVTMDNLETGRPLIAGLGNLLAGTTSSPVAINHDFSPFGNDKSIMMHRTQQVGLAGFRYDLEDRTYPTKLGGVQDIADAATSASVVWQETPIANANGISSISAVADGGSTLSAADYEYVTTIVSRSGETGAATAATGTVTVASGERVDLTFSNSPRDGVERRVYRRIQGSEIWQGYFVVLTANNSLSDTGQAFDGSGEPPVNSTTPIPMIEDDAEYRVVATPSWATTVGVSNKATTGFDLTFGTAAPTANETVDWLIFRE